MSRLEKLRNSLRGAFSRFRNPSFHFLCLSLPDIMEICRGEGRLYAFDGGGFCLKWLNVRIVRARLGTSQGCVITRKKPRPPCWTLGALTASVAFSWCSRRGRVIHPSGHSSSLLHEEVGLLSDAARCRCGKTVVFSSIAHHFLQEGKRVILLAHRRELLHQAEQTMSRMLNGACDIQVGPPHELIGTLSFTSFI